MKHAQQHIFSTQYTALMLIILTFVVGAFAKPASKEIVDPRGSGRLELGEPPIESPPSQDPLGVVTYPEVFSPQSNNLNTEMLAGVELALRSHDIRAELIVRAEHHSHSVQLLARMESVYRWLESLRIPRNAFLIEAQFSSAQVADQLDVRITRDASHE